MLGFSLDGMISVKKIENLLKSIKSGTVDIHFTRNCFIQVLHRLHYTDYTQEVMKFLMFSVARRSKQMHLLSLFME